MKLPKITDRQKQILWHLYQFRFLNTYHLQKILNHKNPKRTQSWVKDLKDKKYINTNYSPKSLLDKNKPAVYYLSSQSRHILKVNKNCDLSMLSRIYKEKTRSQKYIDHCLAIADVYVFFLSQKTDNQEINFFTESNLIRFEYFPDPLPSVYISIKTENGNNRYFLDFFDKNTPSFVLRKRVKQYIEYFENGTWQENSNNSPFPAILFVCPDTRLKKHIYFYGKAVLEKTFNTELSIYLTTKSSLSCDRLENEIWEKIE